MSIGNKVSIKQIAESIPCSPSTVSLVLNGNGDKYRISQQTQKMILGAAKRLGYSSNDSALKPEESSNNIRIGLFLGFDESSPICDMISAICDVSEYAGKSIEYCFYPFYPSTLIRLKDLLLHNDFDGMLLMPYTRDECNFLRDLSLDKPCVVVNKNIPGMNCVLPDRIECGAAVARLFIEKNYNSVGLLTRNTLSDSGKLRSFGFTSTYEKCGPSDAAVLIVDDNPDEDNGFSGMNKLLDETSNKKLDAVFVTEPNDFSGVINSMRANGKTPPADFDLVVFGSYSDNSISQCLSPSITTIGFPIKAMVKDGIDLLCHQIEGGILHGVSKVHAPEFCFRESCEKPEIE